MTNAAMRNALLSHVPDMPFDRTLAPAAPDYDEIDNPSVWVAWPGRPSAAESFRPLDDAFTPESERICNCFFIHPTTSIPGVAGHPTKIWNAPFDCTAADTKGFATVQGVAKTQASAFNGTCRMFMPRYRQMSLSTYEASDLESCLKAMDLAYSDVLNAFEKFLKAIGPGSPFILAGHSQGTLHGKRLLLERIDPDTNLARRMVVSYLIGSYVQKGLVARLKHVPEEKVVGFDTLPADITLQPPQRKGALFSGDIEKHPYLDRKGDAVVRNPLEWTGGVHLGLMIPSKTELEKVALDHKFISTVHAGARYLTCGRPHLHIADTGYAPPRWLAMIAGGENLHNMDYMIWYYNIRADVAKRVAAYGSNMTHSRL